MRLLNILPAALVVLAVAFPMDALADKTSPLDGQPAVRQVFLQVRDRNGVAAGEIQFQRALLFGGVNHTQPRPAARRSRTGANRRCRGSTGHHGLGYDTS